MAGKVMRMNGALAILALSATLVACSGGDAQQQTQAQGGGAGGNAGAAGGQTRRNITPTVEVQTVARGSIAREVTMAGSIEPVRTVGVNSQLGGALTTLSAQEGDIVRAGAVLARMDDRELAAQLTAAEASLQVAEASFQRAEQLRERKVITLPEYERERTGVAAARAQVEQLRTRIGYATVKAPVSGVITEKNVEAGDVVGNNARLFSIADVSELVVRVGVSELDVVELRQNDPVRITLDALRNRELRGRIRRVFPAGDPQTRLVPVEVVLDRESARAARPGFLARVTFALSSRNDVLLLPVGAVLGGQGAQAVFVVDNNTVMRRTVTTGLTSQGRVEIVSGLEEGDQVVVVGNNSLRDGMTVRTAGSTPTAPPASTSDGTPAPTAPRREGA